MLMTMGLIEDVKTTEVVEAATDSFQMELLPVFERENDGALAVHTVAVIVGLLCKAVRAQVVRVRFQDSPMEFASKIGPSAQAEVALLSRWDTHRDRESGTPFDIHVRGQAAGSMAHPASRKAKGLCGK
jgi:hypothetical protein